MTFLTYLSLILICLISAITTVRLCKNNPNRKISLPFATGVPLLCTLFILIRHGAGIIAFKYILLICILLYASLHDIANRLVPDSAWVCVLLASLVDLNPASIPARTVGLLVILLPQLFVCVLSRKKSVGGADIKLSAALGFFFGGFTGLGILLSSYAVSVISMLILKKVNGKDNGLPLIPFLSGSALLACLI